MTSILRVLIFLFIITSMLFMDVLRAIDSEDDNSIPSQNSSSIYSSPSHSSLSDLEENPLNSPSTLIRTSSESNTPLTNSLANQVKEATSLLGTPSATTDYGSLRGRPTWQIVRSDFSEEEEDLNLRKEGQVDEPQRKLCCFNFCLWRGSSHKPDPKKAKKGLQLAPSIQQNSDLNL